VTCRKPFSNASASIASVVIVADSGSPPPSVLDSATKSGHHVVLLEREHRPHAAERRLRLVDDEQHPALLAALLEPREVAVGQRHDAARAQDRLDDRGGRRADRLGVGEREAGVEAGEVAAVAAVGDRAAVGVRRRQRHRAGQRRAVAAPAGAVGARRGPCGHAVPRAREGEHLVAAGVELREAQRGLVRLAAGGEEHRAGERRGQQRHQLAGELGDVAREEAAEQVHGAPAGVAHRVEDGRVAVAERGAHLAGGEVEQLAPVLGGEPAALRALDEEVGEVPGVADQVIAAGAESVLGVDRGGGVGAHG
jgi:hypothetical protein